MSRALCYYYCCCCCFCCLGLVSPPAPRTAPSPSAGLYEMSGALDGAGDSGEDGGDSGGCVAGPEYGKGKGVVIVNTEEVEESDGDDTPLSALIRTPTLTLSSYSCTAYLSIIIPSLGRASIVWFEWNYRLLTPSLPNLFTQMQNDWHDLFNLSAYRSSQQTPPLPQSSTSAKTTPPRVPTRYLSMSVTVLEAAVQTVRARYWILRRQRRRRRRRRRRIWARCVADGTLSGLRTCRIWIWIV